jgi:hypothetical protein
VGVTVSRCISPPPALTELCVLGVFCSAVNDISTRGLLITIIIAIPKSIYAPLSLPPSLFSLFSSLSLFFLGGGGGVGGLGGKLPPHWMKPL